MDNVNNEKTIVGTLSQVFSRLMMKFDKRLYLGQIFKVDDYKYRVNSLSDLGDGRVVVRLVRC